MATQYSLNFSKAPIGTVYLIHFKKKLCHAQHYIGWTSDPDIRIKQHRNGRGSRLMEVIQEKGIPFEVVRTWPGETRSFERWLKDQKKARTFCPICSSGNVRVVRKGKNHG